MKIKKVYASFLIGAMMLSLAACSGSTKKIESPADFEGAKISVQTATSAHESIQDMQDEGMNINVLPYEKVTQCFDDLALGRVDAVYVDSVVAGYYLAEDDTKYQKTWTSETGEPIGVCLKKGNDDLKELIEGAIDTLYYDGTMAQLSEKHFGSAADVDGVRNVTEKPVLDLFKLKTLKDGTLTVGVEVGYPPMEYTDDAGLEYQGFDIDFAKALGEVLGVDIEFVNTAWDGIFAGLDKEQYDVIISSVSITPERQAAYDLTEPYVSNQLVIVTLK